MKMTLKKLLKNQEFPTQLFDKNGNEIYCEYSNGYSYIKEYDSNNNLINCEHNNGYSYIQEFDSNNNRIYWENSQGIIFDNRPKKWYLNDKFFNSSHYNYNIVRK